MTDTKSRKSPPPRLAPLAGLILLGGVLWGCDDSATAPLEAERAMPSTAVDQGKDSSLEVVQPLAEPVLPPGIRNMPPGQAMRTELVGYPSTLDVGVCFTQIANPGWLAVALPAPWLDRTSSGGVTGRDFVARWLEADPFWLYRLEVELPEEAWAEAEGRIALFESRLRDQHGYVHRLARCVIPASQVAVDHLRLRFSRGRPASPDEPAPATSCSAAPAVSTSFDAGLQDMVSLNGDACPPGYCTCDRETWSDAGHCDCLVFDNGCFPRLHLDEIKTVHCQGFGTHYNWDLEACDCMDPTHQMDEFGDCQPTHPDDDDGPSPGPDCPDPYNPDCDLDGGSPEQPPPPPPVVDSMSITLTLSPAEETPGGATEVIVQVSPAQAGVPVEVWTSASGDGVGVFGASAGSTDANGQFSTTYTTALAVHVETIWATATSSDEEILVASADLTVGFGCGDERDHIILEYAKDAVNLSPQCGWFTTDTSVRSVYFANHELTHASPRVGPNPHAPFALIRWPLVVHPSSGWGLDRVRELWGNPINLNSGYRCPHANEAAGSTALQSRHMFGDAADLRVESRTQDEAEELLSRALEADAHQNSYIGYSNARGVVEPAWVHVDWRHREGGYVR